jgi:flagellar hook-associated protein 2
MSTPPIQMSGLVSGLDTASIIDQLMAAEKIPRTKITNDQAIDNKKVSIYNDLSTKLTALKTANDDLSSALTWIDTQSVESTDATKFTVSRTGGAPPGGYDVSVDQLASAERQTWSFTSPSADGQMVINNADGTPRSTVNLRAGATVDDAVSAINGATGGNLYAVNVNGSLVLSAKTTGASSGFSIAGAGAGTQTERIAGNNAKLTINGTQYERESNTIKDALPGVQFVLKGKTAAGTTEGLTVGSPGPDKDAITTKVKAFVAAYNDVVTAGRGALTDTPVVNASAADDIVRGSLFGDSGLNDMLSSFRSAVSAAVPGLSGTLRSLADIGISTGASTSGGTINQDSLDGKLTLDETKLSTALDSDPLTVRTLLGGTANVNGFAQQFRNVLRNYQGSAGLIQARITSTNSDLSDLAAKLTTFDARMDSKQQLLTKQFTAMETAMANSQAAGSKLSSFTASSS